MRRNNTKVSDIMTSVQRKSNMNTKVNPKDVVHITPSNDPVTDMAQTVASWLIYNSSVSGAIGVQENMINYPIKSFLVCHQNEWEKATFEETHPHLAYRRIDFFYLSNAKKKYYFEFKQAKADTEGESEFQRIYNDLIRLAICKKKDQDARCLFLVFGDVESYKTFFVGGRKDDLSYSNLFCFKKSETNSEKRVYPKSSKLTDNDSVSLNELAKKFFDKYNPREKEYGKTDKEIVTELVPDEIYIKLVWTNYKDDAFQSNAPDIVGVWEVLLEPSKDEFKKRYDNTIDGFIDSSTGSTFNTVVSTMPVQSQQKMLEGEA